MSWTDNELDLMRQVDEARERAERAEATVEAQAEILQEVRQCIRTMDRFSIRNAARIRSMLAVAGDLIGEMDRLGRETRKAAFRSVSAVKAEVARFLASTP